MVAADLTAEYLQSVDWEAPIREVAGKSCENFWSRFFAAAQVAKESGDVLQSSVFVLLGKTSSFYLRSQDKHTPFAPMMVYEGKRTADITDLSQDEIESLKAIFPVVRELDLRARLADIVWTAHRQGNFQYAEQAIDAYLLAGEVQIRSDPYVHGVEKLSRALHLAASLGRHSNRYRDVISKLDSLIDSFLPHHDSPVNALVKLLLEYHGGAWPKLGQAAEACALDAETKQSWYVAGEYWHTTARVYRIAKETGKEREALYKYANSFAQYAVECAANGQSFAAAAHHVAAAIEILRRIPGSKEQQSQLHKTMLEYQQRSVKELHTFTSEAIDLTAEVENAIANIRAKPLKEAIFQLALFTRPVSKAQMVRYIEEMASTSPLLALITNNIVDSNGRVTAKIGSILADSKEEAEAAREGEMLHWARYQQNALAAVVEPARHYLLIEHNPTLADILEIVENNPFVPIGREAIFAQGLLSGLQGDFLVASHLLIPQVENSLRHLLRRSGVITSGLSSNGIQEELPLEKLLDMPETAKIFDEDLVFGLKGCLSSKFGGNFRNLLAHGMLAYGQFSTYDAIYIWWLVLKICCMPMIDQQEIKDASPQE